MRRSAFTLIETLTVVAVLLVLFAIVFGIGSGAVKQAHNTRAMANLKQHHLALEMYRTDYGGDGVYGTASQMGLPPARAVYTDPTLFLDGLRERSFRSTCTAHPSEPDRTLGRNLSYYPTDEPDTWEALAESHLDATVVVGDFNCNDSSVDLDSMKELKLGIGVTLGGNAVRRWSAHGYAYQFWYD